MNKRPILVAFSNQKGGVGKSTVTAVLASYFNYVRGLKVAVVDCDYPQFSITPRRSKAVPEKYRKAVCRYRIIFRTLRKVSIISDFSAVSLRTVPVRPIRLSLLLRRQPQRFPANWKATMT